MPIAGLDDLLTPAAFALSQACQVGVAIILSIPCWGWPDVDAIAALFGQVPRPHTYSDALHSALLLHRFLERSAVEIHARVHGGTVPVSCLFDAARSVAFCAVDQAHPESWNARAAFAAWSVPFVRAFANHHPHSLADRAIQRIRARFSDSVTASDVARDVGCSLPVLHRTFRHATGQSLRQYAIQLRIDRAIDLLRDTDWKVEAIAREVGWKSKKDLNIALARRVGRTPSQVRRLRELQW